MIVKKIKSSRKLRSGPSGDSKPVSDGDGIVYVNPSDKLIVLGESAGWSEVRIDRGGGSGPKGYAPTDQIVDVALKPSVIPLDEFASDCAWAALALNIDLPYLLALARVESGIFWNDSKGVISAKVFKDSGATGPFQFMPKTWAGLVEQRGKILGIRLSDIINPKSQAVFAAFLVNEAIEKHSGQFGGLPSPAVTYLYHFFGWPTALEILKGPLTDPVDSLLMRAKNGDAAQVKRIIDGNKSLLTASGTPRSLVGVIDEAAGRLASAYAANAQLFQSAADWWPNGEKLPVAPGDAPWLEIAKQEMGVTEKPNPEDNPKIVEYLSTVGFGPNENDETAWCAAFVCWCLVNSGDPEAKETALSLPNRSYAKSWKNLPSQLTEPHIGAIGILPPTTDATGHVGFVVAVGDDGKVDLLAGNQRAYDGGPSNTVSVRRIPKISFVEFKWPTNGV